MHLRTLAALLMTVAAWSRPAVAMGVLALAQKFAWGRNP